MGSFDNEDEEEELVEGAEGIVEAKGRRNSSAPFGKGRRNSFAPLVGMHIYLKTLHWPPRRGNGTKQQFNAIVSTHICHATEPIALQRRIQPSTHRWQALTLIMSCRSGSGWAGVRAMVLLRSADDAEII